MEFNQSEKDSILSRLTEIIEANLSDEHFGVSELAREMSMSRSNLHRKVKAITNITASQFIRGVRLKRALEHLRESSMTISEVAIESGFSSLTYFTKCFNDYYGVPPSKYSKIEQSETIPYNIRQPQGNKKKHSIRTARVWIIVALITVISAILLILILGPTISNPFIRERTIAILPYSDSNPEAGNAFLFDGLMNEIRYNLGLVEDLAVVSRTSVERYRNTDKTYREIGKELNVNYILACSADTIQSRPWIRLQLIDAHNNKNLWPEPFEREISLDNIFEVQKEVTLTVTNDLKAELAFKEKEQIERNPTENLAAYNLFMLGINYMNISYYSPDIKSKNDAMIKAKQLYEQAIELDSTFADAYAELASIYIYNFCWSRSYLNPDKEQKYLDSGLVLLDRALLYDGENPGALKLKAAYLERIGRHQDAMHIHEKFPDHDELTFMHYQEKVMRFSHVEDYYVEDYYDAIENYLQYLRLKPEEIIVPPYLLRTMMVVFRHTGYPEHEKQMAKQLFDFNNDSVEYLHHMVSSEIYQGNFEAALSYAMEASNLDSEDSYYYFLIALCYLWLEDYTNALHYLVISEDRVKQKGGIIRPRYLSGYTYAMNGYETEADYHLKGALSRRLKNIEYATPGSRRYYSHFYIACIYLALGDENKALEYLENLKALETIDYGYINILVNGSGFENIRTRPEFQSILSHLEDTFQKQQKRIGPLIEELEDLDNHSL